MNRSLIRPLAILVLIAAGCVIAWRLHVAQTRSAALSNTTSMPAQNPDSQQSAATSKRLSKPSPGKSMQTIQQPAPPALSAPIPGLASGPQNPGSITPALPLPSQTAFRARHKHGFGGGCEGELRFDGDLLTFTSREHPLSLTRGQVQGLDGDGIKDGRGKNWHFEIRGLTPGQVRTLFARWLRAAGPG